MQYQIEQLPHWMRPPAPALPPFMQAPQQPSPDLTEAARLIGAGFHIIKLVNGTKRPEGDDWNNPSNYTKHIDPSATGYGIPLAANGLVSIDPDNAGPAAKGLIALGFDLEALMQAGVRTRSTRPGSGGRSIFKAPAGGGLAWLKFSSKVAGIGTVLELRATSTNLQDVVPGVVYRDKSGAWCQQHYAGQRRIDDAPELPPDFLNWWHRCSVDLEYFRSQQELFFKAIGVPGNLATSGMDAGGKVQLAFESKAHRSDFNSTHAVPDILRRHGYKEHRGQRWEHPAATGQPGIREIPGKNGLWRSDHGGDPLTGTFDAWNAYVILDHDGDLSAAQRAFDVERAALTAGLFPNLGPVEPVGMAGDGHQLPKVHPWTIPSEPQLKPLAQRFVIDGLIQEGVVLIAGYRGAGKTVNLLSLYLAGVCGIGDPASPLTSKRPRRLIWLTEDTDQVWRVVRAIKAQGWATDETIKDRLTVVAASRITSDQVAGAVPFFKSHGVTHDGVTLAPAIVLDTKSACFDVDDENSNSQNSEMIAACRDTGMNITLVTHTSKAISRSTDPASMSARGAGSQEADVAQTAYLVEDGGMRYLLIGKKRFEMPNGVEEVAFDPRTSVEFAKDAWGDVKSQTLRCARPRLTSRDQRTATAEASKARKIDEALTEAVRQSDKDGGVLSRTKLVGLVEIGSRQARLSGITRLIASGVIETYIGELAQYEAAGIKQDTLLLRLRREKEDTS